MPIELAGIQLNRVHKIVTLEQPAFAYHRIPGLLGNVVQDLGRDSVRLQIEGIFFGPNALKDLDGLRKIHKKRDPVDFLAEIVGQAYFSQVTLESFEVFQLADAPEEYSYSLTVAEYVAPPKPAAAPAPSSVDVAIRVEAQGFIDIATLPDRLRLGSLPELTNPAEPLSGALGQITTASEGLQGVTTGLTSLFDLKVDAQAPPLELPADWGTASALAWAPTPPAPPDIVTPDAPLFGPNGELLGPDGRALRGSNGELLGPDGKRLLGPDGELLDSDGKPLVGPDGKPIGPDGKPIELTAWASFELVNDDGKPAAGARYIVNLGAGRIRTGTLDAHGKARIEGLKAGQYAISFPDLDAGDWGPPAESAPPEGAG